MILGFGFGVHPEYQSCSAVVTRAPGTGMHCMASRLLLAKAHSGQVAVLDPSRSFRVGECQVALDDVKPAACCKSPFKTLQRPQVHKEWRAGARLVIGGLQSSTFSQHF